MWKKLTGNSRHLLLSWERKYKEKDLPRVDEQRKKLKKDRLR